MTAVTSPKRDAAPYAAPVVFRGVEHRATKGFFLGTHRTCPPEETYERIEPLLAGAGITRMADVTGLDRIGIPTVLAIRPNAPTLSNASGKGFTRTAAMVSAAMEGIELFAAEEFRPVEQLDGHGAGVEASYCDLERDGLVCPVEDLALTRRALFDATAPEEWVLGYDLVGRRAMAVPFACVGMRAGYSRDRSRFSFQVGSNGLASGNVLLEALCAGLYEVIERDAVTCSHLRADGHLEREARVDLAATGHDSVLGLADRLAHAGITPLLFDCTCDTAVPTYVAYLVDDLEPATGTFRGYGAHLDPEIAILRALTEAVQSRAVYIAGSRDDLMGLEHRRLRRVGAGRALGAAGALSEPSAPARTSAAGATFEADVATLVAAIRAVGLDHVVAVDLAPADLPVSVVRVVVPGLEGYHSFDHYSPGRRGRAAQAAGNEPAPTGGRSSAR